jgi:FKBP-type peptidyl-prolyl cis-trans isomerase
MKDITQDEKIAIIVVIVVIVGFFFLFANPFAGSPVDPLNTLTEGVDVESNEIDMNDNEVEGVEIQVLVEGEGEVSKSGDLLTVHYTGGFQDGTVFDTSLSEGREPFRFLLGAGQVIPGWEQGVLGMKVGERRLIIIQPELGYGPDDYGPIPGGSVLVFEVELLSIETPSQ